MEGEWAPASSGGGLRRLRDTQLVWWQQAPPGLLRWLIEGLHDGLSTIHHGLIREHAWSGAQLCASIKMH